ncbi:hypothetical protein, partial [Streptococcus danieliae]|uniref:hypothetical protein n=1 Tax=Streptococcus danieliae TaxID=747656 RepID=UPI001C54D727
AIPILMFFLFTYQFNRNCFFCALNDKKSCMEFELSTQLIIEPIFPLKNRSKESKKNAQAQSPDVPLIQD